MITPKVLNVRNKLIELLIRVYIVRLASSAIVVGFSLSLSLKNLECMVRSRDYHEIANLKIHWFGKNHTESLLFQLLRETKNSLKCAKWWQYTLHLQKMTLKKGTNRFDVAKDLLFLHSNEIQFEINQNY